MPTKRQQTAFSNMVENGGNISRAMLDAGYAPTTAKTPQKLLNSKAWKDVSARHLPDEVLLKQLRQMIDSNDWQTVRYGLDIAFKLKGYYHPPKPKRYDPLAGLSDKELTEQLKLAESELLRRGWSAK